MVAIRTSISRESAVPVSREVLLGSYLDAVDDGRLTSWSKDCKDLQWWLDNARSALDSS